MSPSKQHLSQGARRLLQPVAPLLRAVQLWLDAEGLRMSAAMSFYGMLSLAPLLLLLVGVLGWWVDKAYLESTLIAQVQGVMGERGAEVVRMALASAQAPAQGWLASIAGFVLLLSGATGVFVELQAALARLWAHGHAPERRAWWHVASLRLRGLAYVLAIGFLLLISLVLSTTIKVVATWAGALLPFGAGALLQFANEAVAFAVAVLLFVGLMRIGGGPKPPLSCLVFGAAVGAALFTAGKQLLAWYLSTAAVVSAYGAAGSLVVLLMWIYFSSAVLLFGASCARALDEARAAAGTAPAGPTGPG
ncbi:YihY/virulence factor BrkB family protein [Alicycliphilus sp. T452]|jgi:membrane protein